MASSDSEDKKVMDVHKPGESAADASSRPVIVKHGSPLKDPMVKDDDKNETKAEADSATEAPAAIKTTAKKIIAPLPGNSPKDKSVDANGESKDTAKPSEPEKEEEPAAPAASATSDSAAVDALAEQAGSKKQANKESEEELEKQQAVQKLIEEKKFFVPISNIHKKKNLLWASLALLLVAAAAGGYLFFNNDTLSSVPIEDTSQEEMATVSSESQNEEQKATEALPDKTLELKDSVLISHKKGFSITVPGGWKVANVRDKDYVFARQLEDITSKDGARSTVRETSASGGDGIMRFSVVQFTDEEEHGYPMDHDTVVDFKAGELTGKKYYKKWPVPESEGESGEDMAGVEVYSYEFKTPGKTTYVIYQIVPYNKFNEKNYNLKSSDPDQLELVEDIVTSLKIN